MPPKLPSIVPKPRGTDARTASSPVRPGPVLLERRPEPRRPHSLLALWHLLSLDAPTVAAVWTWFMARCCGVPLPWASPAAMFLAVWMLYVADRLLDARAPGESTHLEERHRFHHRNRSRFLAGLAAASCLLAALLPRLDEAELRLFAALGSLLFAYFFLIHLWPSSSHNARNRTARLPKELAVGVFFPAAVFVPTVARMPSLRLELLPVALLMAAVCTLNCLYVYRWEHPGKPRDAHWTTRHATRHITGLCAATGATCAAASVTFALSPQHTGRMLALPAAACACTAVFFFLLDASRKRMQPVSLRAWVDLALLTPLPLAAFLALSPW